MQLRRLLAASALALMCIGCASDPPPAPPPLEVLRTTNADGSVRYTIRRNSPSGEAQAEPRGASSPSGTEVTPGTRGDGEEPDGALAPGDEIRGQLETDREFLRQMISREAPAGFERTQSPELREIAERLPRLQAELEALENEPEP